MTQVAIHLMMPEETATTMLDDVPVAIAYWGSVLRKDRKVVIVEHEDENGDLVSHTLPSDWIAKGLQVLMGTGYQRIGELLIGTYDRDSLDVLVQAAIFGKMVYG